MLSTARNGNSIKLVSRGSLCWWLAVIVFVACLSYVMSDNIMFIRIVIRTYVVCCYCLNLMLASVFFGLYYSVDGYAINICINARTLTLKYINFFISVCVCMFLLLLFQPELLSTFVASLIVCDILIHP